MHSGFGKILCRREMIFTTVCFINANIGWAVGNAGTILNTTDGGISWTDTNE